MDKKVFSRLFIEYIKPKLKYASKVWSLHLPEKIQKRTTKMTPELRKPSYSERSNAIILPTSKEMSKW